MEEEDSSGDLPSSSLSSRSSPPLSFPSSTQPAVSYSEYHPVGNHREPISYIPVYHPENNYYFIYNNAPWAYHHPSHLLRPPQNQDCIFFPPANYLIYVPNYYPYHHQNLSNSLYPSPSPVVHPLSHQTAMHLQMMRFNAAVDGQSFTANPYNFRPQNSTTHPFPTYYHQSRPHRGLTNTFEPCHDRLPRTNEFFQARERQKYSSLEEIRGRIATVAMESDGWSFLQKKLKESSRDEFVVIFSELIERIPEIMMDQFGHHLILDLYNRCNEEDITRIVHAVSTEDNLTNICLDVYGTLAIRTLLENYLKTRDQISILLPVLRSITITLSKSDIGFPVINKCLSTFLFEDTECIANEVANNCVELAMSKSGCCVLQTFVTNAKGESRERIIDDITANALILSEIPYGNYVVQFLVGIEEPRVIARVIAELEGRFVPLSMNKYGSNVVEQCFNECTPEQCARILTELITSPDFVSVLQDQYGNYVAQAALNLPKEKQGPDWNNFVQAIWSHYPSLERHPHGQGVLRRLEKTGTTPGDVRAESLS